MPAGAIIQLSYNEWFPVPGVNLSGVAPPTGPRDLYDPATGEQAGSFAAELPLELVPYSTVSGGMIASYFDDFYNRIYIEPGSVDFGSISEEVTRNLTVWNAYHKRSITLDSLNFDTSAGISVGGHLIPTLFAPLEVKTFQLIAGVQGPPLLETQVNWSFDAPFFYQMPVNGTRALVWKFEPNWPPAGSTYRISYDFKTEIIVSRSGREQRIALRDNPRKSLSHQVMLVGDQFREFKDSMWYWQHRSFVMPELVRSVLSSVDMEASELTMVLESLPSWAAVGSTVILDYFGQRETRTVEDVDALTRTLTFKSSTASTWPAGTKLYPALFGNVGSTLQAPRLTNAVATLALSFDVTPLTELWVDPPAASLVFNSREVFLKKPNWAEALTSSIGHEVEVLDFERGATYRSSPVPYGVESRRGNYLGRDTAQVQELLDFFRRMRGRQGEFYMPTWEYDFEPKIAAAPISTGLRVTGKRLAECYGDSTVHKAMFVMLISGAVLLRRVVSVMSVSDSDGEDSVITVDANWGTTISKETIVMCGWLPVWRLSSDTLTVEWLTNQVGQVQITMQTLEDLPV
jgi:hypothetical protein